MADNRTTWGPPDEIKKSGQVTELLGRNHVVNELLRLGYEVAYPARDRGIDFIIYQDLGARFRACPVQLKVASTVSFNIDRKYRVFPNLLMVYVWYMDGAEPTTIFTLTYAEAVAVANNLQGSQNTAWMASHEKGRFAQSSYSKPLEAALQPYRMTGERWHDKLRSAFGDQEPERVVLSDQPHVTTA